MVYRSFFFGPREFNALLRSVPLVLRGSSRFVLMSACIWYCRTIALDFPDSMEVCMMFAVNAHTKFDPPLPVGYYGNACAFPGVVALAGKIRVGKLEYAIRRVKEAKDHVMEEYMRSTASLMVLQDRPFFRLAQVLQISDVSALGFSGLDFGWGKPVYSGPPDDGMFAHMMNYFVAYRNVQGEDGKMVQICLPADAMERFVEALSNLLINN